MSSSIYYHMELKDEYTIKDLYEICKQHKKNLNCNIKLYKGKVIIINFKEGVSESLGFEIKNNVINDSFKWWNDDEYEYFRILDLFIDFIPMCKKIEIEDDEEQWEKYHLTREKPVIEKVVKEPIINKKMFTQTFNKFMFANGFIRKQMSYLRLYGDDILQLVSLERKPGYYEFYVKMIPLYQEINKYFFESNFRYFEGHFFTDFEYILTKNFNRENSAIQYLELFKNYGLPILNRTKTAVDLYRELKAFDIGFYEIGNIEPVLNWKEKAEETIIKHLKRYNSYDNSHINFRRYPQTESQMVAALKAKDYDEVIHYIKIRKIELATNNMKSRIEYYLANDPTFTMADYDNKMKELEERLKPYYRLMDLINNKDYNEINNILNNHLEKSLNMLYKYCPKVKKVE